MNHQNILSVFQQFALCLLALVVPRFAGAQTFDTIFADDSGRNPRAALVQGSDGDFYGTTVIGGTSDYGTVYKITPSGTLTTLVSFSGTDGKYPSSRMVEGHDGNFYGTTVNGGTSDNGTVYKMTPTGMLTTLVSFSDTDGSAPYAGVVEGSDGNFYGTTVNGGTSGNGTVYKMTPTGTLTTLVSFNSNNGSFPYAGVVEGSDGNFYGTTRYGGVDSFGTMYRLSPTGTLVTLANFNRANGDSPNGELVEGSDGNFYGTTSPRDSGDYGTVFKATPSGILTTLVTFDGTGGRIAGTGLVRGSDGNFFGVTNSGGEFGLGMVFKMTPTGTLTTVLNFAAGGNYFFGGIVMGNDNNLYGTTDGGGASGLGTVYKVTLDGTLTTLASFHYPNGTTPKAALVEGSNGEFYGTTNQGGANDYGTVFKVTRSGALTTLINFTATNGQNPSGQLVVGRDGNFYGTTEFGGASGGGTVFKVTPAGVLSTLHHFATCDDSGFSPFGGLVMGSDGNFYGTTVGGGTGGLGTEFKVTPVGTLTTLVNFSGTNGGNPFGRLVLGSDGNFYGTTSVGGTSNAGTIFKMTPAGTLTTLVSFDIANGRSPESGLVEGNDGNFYGTLAAGGPSSSSGAIFRVTPAGTLTTLMRFNSSNGNYSRVELVKGSDGNFYGTTEFGGVSYVGTVFKVTPTGVLTTLHAFDGSSGSIPQSGVVFGSDDKLYGTASPMVIWSIALPVTAPPTLSAPMSSTVVGPSVNVSFSLPEAARPGSVRLTFGTTVFALAASEETAGAHAFTFYPENPTASPEIASGAALADGSYAVTLSYQDMQGNLAGKAGAPNVTIDTQPPVVGGSFSPLVMLAGALPDFRVQATGDAVSYTQTPVPGTSVAVGIVTVMIDGTDAAGNVGHTSFDVRVVPTAPVLSVLESTAAPVPGAGVAGSGIPAGAVWTGFGVPSVNASGQVAFRGDWRTGQVKGMGIFLDGMLAVAGEGEFSVLGDPMLGDDGSVGFVGKTGIFLKPPGAELHAVARLGDVLVDGGGAALKRISSVAMSESGGAFFFTAKLGQAHGAVPRVTAQNDAVLCIVVEGSPPVVKLREGPETKSFLALTERPGSAGNGRGMVDEYTPVLVTGPRGEKLLGNVGSAADRGFAYSLTTDAPGFPPGTKFTKFGLPTQDGNTSIAFRATVQGGITAIFAEDNASQLERLVATTNPAPGLPAGTTFVEMRDPVTSFEQVVAFTAKLNGGGTQAANDESVWFRNSAGALMLVAREGASAAEVGAKWGAFKSIALPEGALGPILLASLKSTPASKVTDANDVGLWATDSFGALRLLLREGDTIGPAKVKSFVVLPTVRGSAAQRRSFSSGRVIVKATDTKDAQHLVHIVVP